MATTGATLGSFGDSPIPLEVAQTANYQVLVTDNGTLFTNTGAGAAVVFTLPALAAGLVFEFLVTAAQSVTIASTAGTDMVFQGNAGRSSLAFSTASEKIGGRLRVQANAAGTKWLCSNLSAGANAASGNRVTAA